MTLEDEPSQVRKCPICYWGKAEDNYDIITTPERMKQPGQSGNDAQLWMCLVKKVKSDAVKNNIA